MASEATSPGILVPLDGSPLAEQALLEPGAALTLLEVVEPPEAIHGLSGRLLVPVEDAQRMLEFQAHEEFQKAEATLHDEPPLVCLEVTRGDPAEELLRVAAERDVNLIEMTTHGRGGVRRMLLGSVADKLVRAAEAPVLLVPARAQNPPRPVMSRADLQEDPHDQ